MNWQRIRQMVKKELIQIRRDRKMARMLIVAPIVQLILFGYAVTTDIKDVRTVVVNLDHTRQSRELEAGFTNSGYFTVIEHLDRPQAAVPLLDSGTAQVALEIPKNFAKDLANGKSASVQMMLDGTDSATASMVMGYTSGIIKRYSDDVMSRRRYLLGAKFEGLPAVEDEPRVWYNPDLKSVNFMVPGILCMILLVTTMMMTSLAVVKEREIGTLEQLIVTPIKPMELVTAKILPFAAIGFVDVLLIVLVAKACFHVPLLGSLLLLLALTSAFLMTSLGTGLFISTISRTQQQAMMTSFFVMQPSVLLSGFLFPIDNMPRAVQALTYILPLRYYVTIVRGIFLKGSGMDVLWPQVAALLVFGTIILTMAVSRFRKRMG